VPELLGRRHHGRTAHGEIATVGERGVEAGEELVDRAGLHQALTEQPKGCGVRHRSVEPKTQEARKRQAVLDLELRGIIRKRIKRLERQDLEHQHRIERRASTPATRAETQCRYQRSAEDLEVDHRGQTLQWIARRAQRLIAA